MVGTTIPPLDCLVMADDDTAPAESFGSDPDGLAQAVAAQRERRAVAAVDATYLCAVAQRLLKEQQ